MRREGGSTKCAKGLHDWTEENVYVNERTGQKYCRPCKTEAARKSPEERHPKGSNHCKRGHEFTPENTIKRATVVDGQKQISRTCRACKTYQGKNGYYSTSVNK